MITQRWTVRPEGSTWGDWGPDDQLGRLNLIGPKQVRKGIEEVKTGHTFCLSLPLDYPGGQILNAVRHPPVLRPVIRNNAPYYNYVWRNLDARLTDVGCDDSVILYTQYSTQWYSLAHRGALFDVYGTGKSIPVYYNGFRADQHIKRDANNNVSAHALGIEKMAAHGVQGRGVLVNLHRHYGDNHHEVGYDELMLILEKDNVVIEPGDILCLWTGLDEKIMASHKQPDPRIKQSCSVLNGWDPKLLQWITESEISAIASDNLAIEATGKRIPNKYKGSNLPLHEHCLFKLGVHLGELWRLGHLAKWMEKQDRSRFLLTAPPLRLPGAVGSPLTPIATV